MSKDHKKEFGRMFIFYHVARQASFSGAAKYLGMSRTMVTQAVEGLEQTFSVRLIHRTTRSFNLTEQGARLFERAQRMVQEYDDACAELHSEAVEAKGKIVMQIPGVLDIPEVHGVLARFMAAHPQVSFDISNLDRVGDLVERQVDLALHIGPLGDSSYHARQIHRFRTFILGSPAYFAAHPAPAHPAELEQHQVFNYRHCLTGDKWILVDPASGEQQTFSIGRHVVVDSERLLVSFAANGRGVASALDVSCAAQLNAGSVVPVLEQWTYPVPLYLVYVSKKSMPRSLRMLLDVLTVELPAALNVQIQLPARSGR